MLPVLISCLSPTDTSDMLCSRTEEVNYVLGLDRVIQLLPSSTNLGRPRTDITETSFAHPAMPFGPVFFLEKDGE